MMNQAVIIHNVTYECLHTYILCNICRGISNSHTLDRDSRNIVTLMGCVIDTLYYCLFLLTCGFHCQLLVCVCVCVGGLSTQWKSDTTVSSYYSQILVSMRNYQLTLRLKKTYTKSLMMLNRAPPLGRSLLHLIFLRLVWRKLRPVLPCHLVMPLNHLQHFLQDLPLSHLAPLMLPPWRRFLTVKENL